ncbi:hypothetical protein BDN70DRAFT_582804 [Pholiota conissans]|uniref:Uncharacterized protein n=1 Tax=Pholiota conissans TaxID=109636 RepID=A0A9P6CRP0_9AGAR|nr:hypothetical protein BDN70DRAFT_582804 [Pholiota conissans]
MLGIARTMKRFFAILFILSTIALTLAMPRARKTKSLSLDESKLLTNSARFQAGLGPLKPRLMHNPTRVRGAHSVRTSPSPSSQPPATVTRMIEARSTDNMSLGFISSKCNEKEAFVLTQNDEDRLSVTYTASSSLSFSLAIRDKQSFLGFSGETLAPPSASPRSYLVEIKRTASSLRPSGGGLSQYKSELSTWTYDRHSHQLTAQSTNVDEVYPRGPSEHILVLQDRENHRIG